jgi:hypothetical protein
MMKLLLKLIWFGLGAFGLFSLGQKYWPQVQPADLIKGVQGGLLPDKTGPVTIEDIKNLEPSVAGQVLGQIVKTEVTKILESTTEQIKTFPTKQVRKIKIGACEELLEEDICSVAKEIKCE